MIIKNYADVPSKDPCALCQCVDGTIVCATQECQPAPQEGCVAVLEEGACCPKYDCREETDTTTYSTLIKTTMTSAEIQDDDIETEEDEIQDDDIDTEEDEIQDDDSTSDDYDDEEEDSESKDSEEDEILTEDEIKELVSVTSEPVQPTTEPAYSSPKPVSSTQLTTLLTSTLAQEGVVTTVTPAPIFGTGVGDIGDMETTTDFSIDLDSIGPGACLFENKIYVSAQQIPRDNPCDFCFCFRGDIICLQQSCPPPIPGCAEEIISGFCCPRYECPVKMSVHNVTRHTAPQDPLSIASWFGWGAEDAANQQDEVFEAEVKGCEVQGEFYEAGSIVTASSGPCLQCR